jgi:hypothetical protein
MTCKGHVTARVSTFKTRITLFWFRVLKYWRFTKVSHGTAHGALHMCYYRFCWTVLWPRRLAFIHVRYFIVRNVRSLFIGPWKMLYIFKVPPRLQMATPKHKEFTSSINEVKQWSMFSGGWRFTSPIAVISSTNITCWDIRICCNL